MDVERNRNAKLDWQAGQSCGGRRVGQGQAKLYFLAELCHLNAAHQAHYIAELSQLTRFPQEARVSSFPSAAFAAKRLQSADALETSRSLLLCDYFGFLTELGKTESGLAWRTHACQSRQLFLFFSLLREILL